jgi:hypothetical protein
VKCPNSGEQCRDGYCVTNRKCFEQEVESGRYSVRDDPSVGRYEEGDDVPWGQGNLN